MKRLLIASIVLAMAGSAFAQTRTQPQTRTTDPNSTITESAKGWPCIKRIRAGRWWSADSYQAGHAQRWSDAHARTSPMSEQRKSPGPLGGP